MNDIKKIDKPSLIKNFGQRYTIDPDQVLTVLKETAFRDEAGQFSK